MRFLPDSATVYWAMRIGRGAKRKRGRKVDTLGHFLKVANKMLEDKNKKK